jgi:aspartate kinase
MTNSDTKRLARMEEPSSSSVRVKKFGGSSLATPERIQTVARIVADTLHTGRRVAVVVSAMGDTTDELVALAKKLNPNPPARELDMLLTSGERIASALLCMALDALGVRASSYTGSQAGIITDRSHGRAKIVDVRPDRVIEALRRGDVPVVAGFQGVSTDTKDVTTLGRGGSDTTAVALAAALGADVCEIYTDVEGVFTADPRLVPDAMKLNVLSYDEMLELASSGAKVLQARCVEYARKESVKIHVRSSFTDTSGTWVVTEEESMEKAIVSGIAHDITEAKLTLVGVPDRPGIAATLFRALAEEGLNIDMIVQNVSAEGKTDISFTVPRDDAERASATVARVASQIGAAGHDLDTGIGKVSLVGAGMRSHPGVAAQMFEVLAAAGINIEMISTSPIRISCVIREEAVPEAVRRLHEAFKAELEEAAGRATLTEESNSAHGS